MVKKKLSWKQKYEEIREIYDEVADRYCVLKRDFGKAASELHRLKHWECYEVYEIRRPETFDELYDNKIVWDNFLGVIRKSETFIHNHKYVKVRDWHNFKITKDNFEKYKNSFKIKVRKEW